MNLLLVLGIAGILLLLVTMTWRLLQPAPRLEIGERGIRDRRIGKGWVRWDEIEGVYQRRSQDGDAVFLRLRATERLVRRLRRLPDSDRPLTVGEAFDLRLDLTDTGFSAVEVVQEIMARSAPPARAPRWPGVPSRERG